MFVCIPDNFLPKNGRVCGTLPAMIFREIEILDLSQKFPLVRVSFIE
jgi:hypothetical protein